MAERLQEHAAGVVPTGPVALPEVDPVVAQVGDGAGRPRQVAHVVQCEAAVRGDVEEHPMRQRAGAAMADRVSASPASRSISGK